MKRAKTKARSECKSAPESTTVALCSGKLVPPLQKLADAVQQCCTRLFTETPIAAPDPLLGVALQLLQLKFLSEERMERCPLRAALEGHIYRAMKALSRFSNIGGSAKQRPCLLVAAGLSALVEVGLQHAELTRFKAKKPPVYFVVE